MIKLSILILTVPSRLDYFFPRIIKQLLDQTKDRNDVEILALFDNKKRTVGQKRHDLMSLAQGEYLTFIDDDDRISPDYIESLMTTIYANPDVDCVVYNTICKVNGGSDVHCMYGIEFEYGKISPDQWRGKPAHTMVWKSTIAKSHKYSHLNNGEDIEWVKRACVDIKTQVRIDKVLYYYDANYATTSETAGLSDDHIRRNVGLIISRA